MEDRVPIGFLLNPKPLSFPFNRTNLWQTIRTGELGREVGALLLSSQVVGGCGVEPRVRLVDEAKSKLFLWVVGNSNVFFGIFTPKIGEDEPIFWLIFCKLGWWKNHQPELVSFGAEGMIFLRFQDVQQKPWQNRWFFPYTWPSGCHFIWEKKQQLEKRDTVDGKNPAPSGMYKTM